MCLPPLGCIRWCDAEQAKQEATISKTFRGEKQITSIRREFGYLVD